MKNWSFTLAVGCFLFLALAASMSQAASGQKDPKGSGHTMSRQKEESDYFFRMQPLVISIFDKGKVLGYIAVLVEIEVPGKETKPEIEKQLVVLRHALLQDLQLLALQNYWSTQETFINMQDIKAQFLYRSQNIVGKDVAKAIMIRDVHETMAYEMTDPLNR